MEGRISMEVLTNQSDPADNELVEAAQSGSADAFCLLVERYYARILAYLNRQTGDADLAADLTQDTFASAFRDLPHLTAAQSFAAWLYHIARNCWRMELRRRRSVQWLSLEQFRRPGQRDRLEAGDGQAESSCAEADQIQECLEALSPSLREALLLRYQYGYTGREIGQILNIS